MILTVAGSPVGSEVFTALAVVAISLVVLLIIRYYVPLRSTPGYLLVPVFFALWLPACIVILMPIDLASRLVWLAWKPLATTRNRYRLSLIYKMLFRLKA